MSGFKPSIIRDLEASADENLAGRVEGLRESRIQQVDVQKSDKVKEDAHRKSLRALNALKIVNPLLCAVIENPGASEEEAISSFKTLVSQTSSLAEQLLEELEIDSKEQKNFWIRNSLERIFADMLRESWVKGKKLNAGRIQSGVVQVLHECGKDHMGESEKYPDQTIAIHLKGAWIKSSSILIQRLYSGFDFFRNLEDDFEPIMKHIDKRVSEVLDEIVDKSASVKDRVQIQALLLQEGVEMYASAWRSVGKRSADRLSRLSDKDLERFLQEHPKGLPIEEVQIMFDKNFSRLSALTQRLLPERVGKIEQRIGKK